MAHQRCKDLLHVHDAVVGKKVPKLVAQHPAKLLSLSPHFGEASRQQFEGTLYMLSQALDLLGRAFEIGDSELFGMDSKGHFQVIDLAIVAEKWADFLRHSSHILVKM